jgi:hypothetical protein
MTQSRTSGCAKRFADREPESKSFWPARRELPQKVRSKTTPEALRSLTPRCPPRGLRGVGRPRYVLTLQGWSLWRPESPGVARCACNTGLCCVTPPAYSLPAEFQLPEPNDFLVKRAASKLSKGGQGGLPTVSLAWGNVILAEVGSDPC